MFVKLGQPIVQWGANSVNSISMHLKHGPTHRYAHIDEKEETHRNQSAMRLHRPFKWNFNMKHANMIFILMHADDNECARWIFMTNAARTFSECRNNIDTNIPSNKSKSTYYNTYSYEWNTNRNQQPTFHSIGQQVLLVFRSSHIKCPLAAASHSVQSAASKRFTYGERHG